MNHYYAAARAYFRRMEGWHLYPSYREPHLWVWGGLVVAWFWSIYAYVAGVSQHGLSYKGLFFVVLFEAAVLLLAGEIKKRRARRVLAAAAEHPRGAVTSEEEFRVRALEDQLQVRKDQFFEVAKEIRDMLAMRSQFRKGSEIDSSFFLHSIYAPEGKQRVLTLLICALTVFTALMARTEDLPPIVEVLTQQGVQQWLATVVVLASCAFLMLVGIRAILSVMWSAVVTWTAKTIPTNESDIALRYMVRDLVRLHRPAGLSVSRPDPGAGEVADQSNHPVPGSSPEAQSAVT